MNKKIVIITIIVLIIDQISKLITQLYNVNLNIIKNVFSLTYYQNTGAAWGILDGHIYILIIITLFMLILVYNLTFSFKESKFNNLCFGFLFGGILGNLIDRIFFGYVRDFINVQIFKYNYPVFNIADSVIVIGVIFLLISSFEGVFKNGNKSRRKSR